MPDEGPSRISIVVVEPKFQGNIGAVARAMKNFDVSDLVLVNPCEVGDEAYQRAMHSKDILENVRVFDDLEKALEDFDYVIATTREATTSDKKHLRKSVSPEDLVEHLKNVEGRAAILFGREDYGLYNTEIGKCDIVVTIPTSDGHPVMNLSHAVAIILYEIYLARAFIWKPPPSSDFERGKLEEIFDRYLDAIGWPEHKKPKTALMLKRIVGRADVSKWEFHTLMGVFHQAIKSMDHLRGVEEEADDEKYH